MSTARRSASRSASSSSAAIRSTRSRKYKKGDAVTCTVVAVQENGIEVKIADSELTTFVKRSDLSRDRSEQRPERFNVGDKVDAAVISVDKAARRIAVSIKALEIAEEKQAVAQYGSSDSGASLGDIFKAAIKKREKRRRRRRRESRTTTEQEQSGVRAVESAARANIRAPARATRLVRGCNLAYPCLTVASRP